MHFCTCLIFGFQPSGSYHLINPLNDIYNNNRKKARATGKITDRPFMSIMKLGVK
jgi:hypothetical protein